MKQKKRSVQGMRRIAERFVMIAKALQRFCNKLLIAKVFIYLIAKNKRVQFVYNKLILDLSKCINRQISAGINLETINSMIDNFLNFIIYVFGGLIVILTGISTISQSENASEKLKKKFKLFTFLAAISGIFVLIAQWRKDHLSDIENEYNTALDSTFKTKTSIGQEKIIVKTDTIYFYQKDLKDSTAILIKGQNKTIEKLNASVIEQNNLVKSQRETIKQVLGEGLPIVEFYGRDKNFLYATVKNNNIQYQLYDLDITFFDFSKLNVQGFRQENNNLLYAKDSLKKYSEQLPPFNLPPNVLYETNYEISIKDLPKYIYIKVISRNSIIHQYSILSVVKNDVIHSFKQYKQINSKWSQISDVRTKYVNEENWGKYFPYKRNIMREYY